MLHIIAHRFRVDRQRSRTVTTLHLLKIELASYKFDDVWHFVDKVRACFASLQRSDLEGANQQRLLYHWLWDIFKDWRPISRAVERIKHARPSSKIRSWRFLWNAILKELEYKHEAENDLLFDKAYADGKIPGAPGKTKMTRAERRAGIGTRGGSTKQSTEHNRTQKQSNAFSKRESRA